jgi:hypothetical protein
MLQKTSSNWQIFIVSTLATKITIPNPVQKNLFGRALMQVRLTRDCPRRNPDSGLRLDFELLLSSGSCFMANCALSTYKQGSKLYVNDAQAAAADPVHSAPAVTIAQ